MHSLDKLKRINFHNYCFEVGYTLECTQSYIQSRRFVLELAPPHHCTLVLWLEHTSLHQHWSTARHQHTWSLRQEHCRKPPQEHHYKLGEAQCKTEYTQECSQPRSG